MNEAFRGLGLRALEVFGRSGFRVFFVKRFGVLGFRVWGLGFRVWGLRFRVWGEGLLLNPKPQTLLHPTLSNDSGQRAKRVEAVLLSRLASGLSVNP